MTPAPAMELAFNATTASSLLSSTRKRQARTWDADLDSQRMLRLMMGPVERLSVSAHGASCVETLDLLGAGGGDGGAATQGGGDVELGDSLELADSASPLPTGWEKCLDLKTGSIYYLNRSTGLTTFCDPRMTRTSAVDWPASPSSSSDLTFEACRSSRPPFQDHAALDLNLSLKPSAIAATSSNNSSVNHHSHSLRSLITSQTPIPTSQTNLGPSKQMSVVDFPLRNQLTSSSANALNGITSNPVLSSSPTASPQLAISGRELDACKDGRRPNISVIGQNIKNEVDQRNSLIDGKELAANYPMMTVGCANCLVFVMLPRSCNPKCPRCGASIDCDLPQAPVAKKTRQQIIALL